MIAPGGGLITQASRRRASPARMAPWCEQAWAASGDGAGRGSRHPAILDNHFKQMDNAMNNESRDSFSLLALVGAGGWLPAAIKQRSRVVS